jgi:hypothetical protein
MRLLRISTMLAIGLSAPAIAQQAATVPRSADAAGSFIVKTVPLHHLSSKEAVALLSPYSQTPGGGVFELPNIRAVTIRELPKIYSDMMTVLAQYDREPATVTLSFQLVAAENTSTRDPAVAGLDSLLRGVLKFSGYRLLSTSVATASENGRINQTLSANGEPLSLEVFLTDLRIEASDASVHLNVYLSRPMIPATPQVAGQPPGQILSTGVTVPIGQTVVLGTSAAEGGQRALILTVRPQLVRR